MVEWLITVLKDFEGSSPTTQIAFILGVVGILVTIAGWLRHLYKRGLREHEARIEALQRERATLLDERNAARDKARTLETEVESLHTQTIAGLRKRATFERRDGNEDKAIRLLRSFVDHDARELAPTCRELALWHLSMVEGDAPADSNPPDDHLIAALRFATLATHLDPDDGQAMAIFAELKARSGNRALDAGDLAATRRDWEEAFSWVSTVADAATLVDTLLARLPKLRQEGHYQSFLAVALRTVTLAKRQFGLHHPGTCTGRFYAAYALKLCGQGTEALAEIDELLPIRAEVSGGQHPDTLTMRWLRASVLEDLGRHVEALAEIDELLPIRTEVIGGRHPDTLTTRWLRASVLQDLGSYAEALAEVDELLPILTEVSGARHPETLATRSLRASVLEDLGCYAEALAEVDELLPISIEVRGGRHPQTFVTRALHASLLRNLGRHAEALAELDELLPIRTEVIGGRHPNTLTTRWLWAAVLRDLGRSAEALAEIDDLLPIETEVSGSSHFSTLSIRRFRASLMRDLGETTDALAEHLAVQCELVATRGESHPSTLRAAHELGLTLAATGDKIAAEALLESTLARRIERLGAEHPDTIATAEILSVLAPAVETEELGRSTSKHNDT